MLIDRSKKIPHSKPLTSDFLWLGSYVVCLRYSSVCVSVCVCVVQTLEGKTVRGQKSIFSPLGRKYAVEVVQSAQAKKGKRDKANGKPSCRHVNWGEETS